MARTVLGTFCKTVIAMAVLAAPLVARACTAGELRREGAMEQYVNKRFLTEASRLGIAERDVIREEYFMEGAAVKRRTVKAYSPARQNLLQALMQQIVDEVSRKIDDMTAERMKALSDAEQNHDALTRQLSEAVKEY